MGVRFPAVPLFLLVTTSIVGISIATKNCSTGGGAVNWNQTSGNNFWGWWQKNSTTPASKKIIVGGSENWHFGFNYSDWAIKNGPFYFNDTIVFKYDAPNATQPFQHSVYLLPNLKSYLKCDFKRATRIASVTDGSVGAGFEFVLTWKVKWPQQQPWYYFACGEHDGVHCRDGGMKFAVLPMALPRW